MALDLSSIESEKGLKAGTCSFRSSHGFSQSCEVVALWTILQRAYRPRISSEGECCLFVFLLVTRDRLRCLFPPGSGSRLHEAGDTGGGFGEGGGAGMSCAIVKARKG